MRENQPTTNNEYQISQDVNLVSETDLSGNIVSCNDAFEAASGFTRDELIGQPHNLIRHPDVPPAIFEDMWNTLKQGLTWRQFVKNRRKDGGFYWVKAEVTPLFSNEKVTGYMSVRSAITDNQKRSAASAYKEIASGKTRIFNGNLYQGMNWQKLNFVASMPSSILLPVLAIIGLAPILFTKFLGAHIAWEIIGLTFLFSTLVWLGIKQDKNFASITKQLLQLASGQPLKPSSTNPRTAVGKLLKGLESVSISVLARQEEAHSQLDKAQQLQLALDKLKSNIMMADQHYNITYMNERLRAFFEEKEVEFQAALPNFALKKLIGSNIDIFHKNPEHNRAMLDRIDDELTTNITVGEFSFQLNVMPVRNRLGVRTGTLVEWIDLSQELLIKDEIQATMSLIQAGVLDQRIDVSAMEGTTRETMTSINQLLDNLETPINDAIRVATAVSEGDLTQHCKEKAHGRFALLEDALNVAVDNLASMIGQTKQAITRVKDGAEEISRSSIDLNDRTQEQAASLEQTAASMEEMTSTVKHNADNAMEAKNTTQTFAQQAQDGVKVMENATESMDQIHDSSEKINDIIALIDSIAFQTNLLALNAAVEAARAGEHGRGFAVVAGEVRSLAGKSADAAKDIRILIENTVQKVSEGTKHVKNSGEALNAIVESISGVNQIIEDIAESSRQQAEGVSQVNLAVTNIDGAVQQNAALVEESAATADHLGNMADSMASTVSGFKISNFMANLHTAAETGGFDFANARRGHRQWRVKVRAYINHVDVNFDRNTAADGNQCALGKWIYGAGNQFAHLVSFKALEESHANLHAFIGSVLDMVDVGDIEQANLEMDRLETMSQEVIDKITALENDIAMGTGELAAEMHKSIIAPTANQQDSVKSSNKPTQPQVTPKVAAASVQKPAPVQPKDNDDEWGEF